MNLMDKKLMLIEYLSRVFYEISQMQHYREKKQNYKLERKVWELIRVWGNISLHSLKKQKQTKAKNKKQKGFFNKTLEKNYQSSASHCFPYRDLTLGD